MAFSWQCGLIIVPSVHNPSCCIRLGCLIFQFLLSFGWVTWFAWKIDNTIYNNTYLLRWIAIICYCRHLKQIKSNYSVLAFYWLSKKTSNNFHHNFRIEMFDNHFRAGKNQGLTPPEGIFSCQNIWRKLKTRMNSWEIDCLNDQTYATFNETANYRIQQNGNHLVFLYLHKKFNNSFSTYFYTYKYSKTHLN